MMNSRVALSSRVSLKRNFSDLPFDVSENPGAAALVISRTATALDVHAGGGFALHALRAMAEMNRRTLQESGCITARMLASPEAAAVLLPGEGPVTVLLNGDDHLTVESMRPGLDLFPAAHECFQVDDRLSRKAAFAFDEQLGYLTASPSEAGTGLRATVALHLPLLVREKKMGEITKEERRAGLRVRPALGDWAANACLYEVSNLSALGRTEQELLHLVTEAALRLQEAEEARRQRVAQGSARIHTEDQVWRALGAVQHARLMNMTEFLHQWSLVRLGAALEMLPLSLETVDALLPQAMEGHLCSYAGQSLGGEALDACRAERIRSLLAAGADGKNEGGH